jgi:DNA-binding MarR family transcriptional regulator
MQKKKKKIYQASQESGYALKEIAECLGLHDTTVSKIIKRVENKEN